jgi:hypothetical protein
MEMPVSAYMIFTRDDTLDQPELDASGIDFSLQIWYN